MCYIQCFYIINLMRYTERNPAVLLSLYGVRPAESQVPSISDSLASRHEQPLTTTDFQHRAPAPALVDGADSESLAIPVAATSLTPPSRDVPVLTDAGLAAELARLARGQDEVLLIANAYTVCVRHRHATGGAWQMLCCGELGSDAIEAAKPLSRKRLTWAAVAGAPWEADPESVPTTKGTVALLNRWLKTSNVDDSGGREGDVTPAIKDELTYLVGWRCQFTGCGRDLRCHAATGSRGRFSYFAHIVAASEDGPRGHPVLSKLWASEIKNFMLLCDECHRLIDKVNPAKYTVEVLQQMREDSIAEVKRLLNSLQHKPAEVIAIVGNIAGQPAQFSMEDAQEALWGQGLRSAETKVSRYFYPGGQHHAVHSPGYWISLFQQMKQDMPLLQTLLDGTRSGAARPRLAVFPLHSTSVLLLAGRVLGDSEGTHLFQPHRNKVGSGTRWAWPKVESPLAALDKFTFEEPHPHAAGQEEAILVVALTSDIVASRMPAACAKADKFLLPTLRITGPTFDKDCMQQPQDLQLFALALDAAMRKLQDDWKVRRVHLFVSAPASAALLVGQKMQARHHADYTCHEALPGAGGAYKATLEITPKLVRELVSGQATIHPLQH